MTAGRTLEIRRGYQRKYYDANKAAINARARARKAANPEKAQAQKFRERGYPLPSRPRPTHCECCGKQPRRTLDLDHDHKRSLFRGWLCNGCNTAIGKLGDNLTGVLRAVAYLEKAYAGAPDSENLG
jgi:hypothetical protein